MLYLLWIGAICQVRLGCWLGCRFQVRLGYWLGYRLCHRLSWVIGQAISQAMCQVMLGYSLSYWLGYRLGYVRVEQVRLGQAIDQIYFNLMNDRYSLAPGSGPQRQLGLVQDFSPLCPYYFVPYLLLFRCRTLPNLVLKHVYRWQSGYVIIDRAATVSCKIWSTME